MFEGDSANTCGGIFSLMSMGGRAEGLACADLGARTPIGVSGNFLTLSKPSTLGSQLLNSFITKRGERHTQVFQSIIFLRPTKESFSLDVTKQKYKGRK